MNLNRPNEYGVPLHACNGYRHDEHRWVYLQFLIDGDALVSTGVDSRDGNTVGDDRKSSKLSKCKRLCLRISSLNAA
jgi:hypothetical protein